MTSCILATCNHSANTAELADFIGVSSDNVFSFAAEARLVPADISVRLLEGFESHQSKDIVRLALQAAKDLECDTSAPLVIIVPDTDAVMHVVNSSLLTESEGASGDYPTVSNQVLRRCLRSGIGLFSENRADNSTVKTLFIQGRLKVCVLEQNFVSDIDFNFSSFVAACPAYAFNRLAPLLRMSGRVNVDSLSRGVIISSRSQREIVVRNLAGSLPVESNIDSHLPDFMNILIASGSVRNKQDAVDFLTWTLYYRRLVSNPNYYGFQKYDPLSLSANLSACIEKAVDRLEQAGFCSCENDFDLNTSGWGLIARHHAVIIETVENFRNSTKTIAKKKLLLAVLGRSGEFVHMIECHIQGICSASELLSRLRGGAISAECNLYAEIVTWVAYTAMSRKYLTGYLRILQEDIMELLYQLGDCLVDVLGNDGVLKATLQCIELMAGVTTRIQPGGSPLLQIPGFTEELCHVAAETFGVTDVLDITTLGDTDRNKLLATFDSAHVRAIAEFCNNFPSVQLEVIPNVGQELIEMSCSISREGTHLGLCEKWWIVIANHSMICNIKRIEVPEGNSDVKLRVHKGDVVDLDTLSVFLMSGSFVGCDIEVKVSIE